jgi:outer membrane lipopolysaccharide assembly protein LptE/RlpB
VTGPVRPLALGLVLLAAALAGCGYSFRGNLPDHIQTVAVPVFANKTGEPAVENFLTSAVLEAYSTNGRLRVVRRQDADAILEGEVVGYSLESIAYDSQANVTQYRLLVTMNLRFRDVRRNKVLFEEQHLRGKADFRVQNSVAQTISREESALHSAAIEIARAIVSLTLTRF